MKKLSFILALLIAGTSLSYSQLRVVTNGSVGIGTITPGDKLHVAGSITINHGSSYKSFRTTGQNHNVLRLDGNDDFVFNATSLTVFGGLPSSALMVVGNNKFYDIRNASNQVMVRVDESTGNMGIGTGFTGPAAKLHVNGSAVKPGGGAWGAASDRQLKNNINAFEDGLETLMQVNPVTFQYNGKAGIATGDKEFVGVIAQELKKAAPYMVENFKYEEKDENGKVLVSEDYLMVDPSALTYMLINAVQEQQKVIEEKDAQINSLNDRLERLERLILKDAKTDQSTNVTLEAKGRLEQNTPNPFSENTTIKYELTDKDAQAEIQIFSLTGDLLKVVPADGRTGQVNVQVTDMPAGTYTYSLVVNGKVIDSKKMVLSK